jgi:hypothetical protein
VYQILEVDDKWNILKCTLRCRRVLKISITLAIIVEFFVIAFFHETKIPMVDMKVQVYSNLCKKKISKNIKSPSFRKWGCCTSILPKALAHSSNFQNKKNKKY